MIKNLIQAHKYFFKEGLDFVRTRKGISLKNRLYLPIAYSKFMYWAIVDFRKKQNEK